MDINEYEKLLLKAEEIAKEIHTALRESGYDEERSRAHVERIMTTVGKFYDRNDLCCSDFSAHNYTPLNRR